MGGGTLIKPRPTTTAIIVCVAASLAAALLGLAYAALIGADKTFGAVAGAATALPIVAFEVFVVQARAGEPLRHLPLWGLTLISTAVWVLSIVAGILIITPVILSIEAYPVWYDDSTFLQDATFSLVVVLFINFSVRIHGLVGTRVLLNFLLGRYHRPLREQQVFMFVDFLDARGLSIRLGDLRAQSLIAAVFFDIDAPIEEFGGEIHRYIGDELVVTWPFRRAVDDARCARCALEIGALLRAKSEHYRNMYGEAPRLRIALHGGPVVVSEIGDDRREIVYFGDTINTTARLRGLAKKIQRTLVISAALLERMRLPDGVRAEDMGEHGLSGKAQATRVYALHGA
ncbi:MAG: adenylate/guanylate cyclase domain-containing protein [Gammaproteobacteria bacterium]|nr:MAG: adenylate/guanylate cyclase domain-containing protein [Gammaproteobacteria bacterium]